MTKIISYLSSPEIVTAVVLPGLISLFWLVHASFRKTESVSELRTWMLCVIGTYFCSYWKVDEEMRQLFIIPVFYIYLAFRLYFGDRVNALSAFALTFLAHWAVDMTRALELARTGDVPFDEFYFGVGGAGLGDGLLFFPVMSALLVWYADVRRKQSQPPWLTTGT
jgi:hypothetical protein